MTTETLVACPDCGSQDLALLNDVTVFWVFQLQEGATLRFDGTYEEEENYHDERLLCRECYRQFPFPDGFEKEFS